MKKPESETDYIAHVFTLLTSQPTAAELDELIEAHARVGYLAAKAEQGAEWSKAVREHAESNAFINAKHAEDDGKRISIEEAKARADIESWIERQAEVEAYGKSRKLKNLLSSVEECIFSVRHIGRMTETPVGNVSFKGNR